ncbi:hypothetical protein BJV74DRAFT_834364 [Russula compacta]|nr:hypothetical protein BJV74DRAFT_834364 [Russula compacta]
MSFRSRRVNMRPSREFHVVLRARDQQVSSLQDNNDTLRGQLDAYDRRLTNARANAHADARAYQLQERKIEQLRMKLRDARAGSAAQRQELEDIRRESEMQMTQLAEAREENLRHLARIAELEKPLQVQPTQVAIDLEAVAKMTEGLPLFDQPPERVPRDARPNSVEMGIQTISDTVPETNQPESSSRQLQDAEDMQRLVLQAQAASERDKSRIRELEIDLEHGRRLNEELRIAAKEERRLVQSLKASSVQEQSRVASLEDAARKDQQAIKVLEATVDEYRSEIDGLEAQVVLLRTLLEGARAFNDDLEESYKSILACKDTFIQDLRERVEELAASEAWGQQREATLHDAQERLAAADVEILELHLELEGAQQNAVTSTNRIIQLEVEASAARHQHRTTDAENGDLRDELGVTMGKVYALADDAEGTIRELRQELDRYTRTLTRLPDGPPIQDDILDGSIDTLVMDPDEQLRPLSGVKDVDPPVSAHRDEQLSHNLAPISAAEAARICGEDVEDILRGKLQGFSGKKLCLDTRLSTALAQTKSDRDELGDSPLEEVEWHSLPPIPEEDEPNTSPILERVAGPRIQTCSRITAKSAVPIATRCDNTDELAATSAESPLLSSPTLSDIWFSNIRVSLALAETRGSVLDWDLPSSGSDSDSL